MNLGTNSIKISINCKKISLGVSKLFNFECKTGVVRFEIANTADHEMSKTNSAVFPKWPSRERFCSEDNEIRWLFHMCDENKLVRVQKHIQI